MNNPVTFFTYLTCLLLCLLSIKATLDDDGGPFSLFGIQLGSRDTWPDVRRQLVTRGLQWAKEQLSSPGGELGKPSLYPYWNFMPMVLGHLRVGDPAIHWSSPCFLDNTASATVNNDGTWSVVLDFKGKVPWVCTEDVYVLATVTHGRFHIVKEEGTVSTTWTPPPDTTVAEDWDLKTKGIRIMRIAHDSLTLLANIVETVLLFEPTMTQGVNKRAAERNAHFLNTYTNFSYPQRSVEEWGLVKEEDVQSGDLFAMTRLDGLDPMLAWGMGSTNAHVVVAVRVDGELYMMESTVKDSYWPTDGVQKTPYKQWLEQAEAASKNVVHIPLGAQARQAFNETAAIEFFKGVEGLEYGYQNMLWSWIDTTHRNYPCLPPDYKSNCMTWEALEPVFAIIDRRLPQIANLLWVQAWNKRLGTTGLRTADLYYEAHQQGLTSAELPTLVEQDEWMYRTTRDGQEDTGRSMVCCVFACSLYKAAGVFGDLDFNCGEVTNYDLAAMSIFEGGYTQIMGDYELTLNDFNSREVISHLAETCPDIPPYYHRPPHC